MKTGLAHSACTARTALAATLTALLLFTSCGGGGGGGGNSPPPPPALKINTDNLPEGTRGQEYFLWLDASGGNRPYEWSVSAGSDPLPPGLSLTSTGNLSGTASSNGAFDFTVQVRDVDGRTASRSLSITVRDPVTITSIPMPSGVTSRDYTYTLEAAGGAPPYQWTLTAGHLPTGLTLNSSGVVSGKPSLPGYFYLTFTAQDSVQRIATINRELRINELLAVETSSLPNINVGASVEIGLHSQGGVQPFQWSLAPGSAALPEGLTVTTTPDGSWGWIQGVVTQPGDFTFTVQVTDSSVPPQTATRDLRLIVGNKLFIQEGYLPVGVVERNYRESVKTFGGTPPYSWKIASGTLPQGLALDAASGEIFGTPEVPIEYATIQVEVTDSSNPAETAKAYIVLTINPPVAFRTVFLPDAIIGVDYGGTWLVAQYGKPPYTFRQVAGDLPAGISLGNLGGMGTAIQLSGTAANIGLSQFTMEVMDSSSPPTVATKEFSIRVVTLLKILTTGLPQGWVGEPYTAALSAEGGVPPYSWNGLWMPQGLTLDESSGTITGTPKYPAYQSAYIEVRDSAEIPQIAETYLMPPIAVRVVIASRLPAGMPDVPYKVKLGLTGGTAPYTWSLSSGNLPEGLSFDPATWQIYGTPTAEGTSNFSVKVTDTGPPVQTVTRALSLTIASDLGRNDSPATATPISNGKIRASISPFADPVAGPANPDHDFYELTANPGSVVTVETTAKRLFPVSPIDTVLEIVDAAGNRLATCRAYTYGLFDQSCLNDDIEQENTQDSRLEFQAPESAIGPVTFFVHVFSWDGNARPDYVYDLTVSGAN